MSVAYSNLEVHQLVRHRRHRVVEAESVLSDLIGSEDEVSLPLFLTFEHDALFAGLFRWTVDNVVDCAHN